MESIRASGDVSARSRRFLAAEEARIADAVVLAEVLAPLLASRLAESSGHNAPLPFHREPSPFGVNNALGGAASSPTVADFIDGMLAQDRADSRSH